ncbi:MAG: hypothetical protein LBC53_05800 [Spirochaetaceae bacterium]|jgi:hypothetical protein|nr:hypothetical protein [Spirochaetaceae bacterium]
MKRKMNQPSAGGGGGLGVSTLKIYIKTHFKTRRNPNAPPTAGAGAYKQAVFSEFLKSGCYYKAPLN